MDTRRLNSWIEISEGAYASNLRLVRDRVGPEVELAAVVKSNAYGHGLELIAGLAARHGVDSFCVHSLDEALRLRRAGIAQDVLILGHVPLLRLGEAVVEEFRLVLTNRESARRLAALASAAERRVRVHLKLETGIHRQGVDESDLGWFLAFLKRHREVNLEGVYTHFADAEEADDSYLQHQLERFESGVERLRAAGLVPLQHHTACSAAILSQPATHFGMVRLGISQYGFWSSPEVLRSYRSSGGSGDLTPVLTWKTRVSQVKDVPAGSFVSYGRTYRTERDSRLAVLPIGYSDGYDRRLSNRAHVLVRGRRAAVRGRVCMNLIVVDVTDVPGVALEDEVVLIGRQDNEQVGAGDLARWVGTIHYEIVTRIQSDLPRILVD